MKNDFDLSLPLKIESNNSLIGFIQGWFPNGQHDPAAIKIAQEALAGINNNVDFLYQLIELIKDLNILQGILDQHGLEEL